MKSLILLYFTVQIIMIVVTGLTDNPASRPDANEHTLSFQKDIFPIIEEHCLPCHLREERNLSRLFMDNYELLMKGGFNGPPVKPGDADVSLLIKKIGPEPPFGERMPMGGGEHLTDEAIELIATWIDQGAKNN
jgi:uncharacterized membrane protein